VRTFVWVDSWQQQCCGDEFGVGSDVCWDVYPTRDGDDWVASLLGSEEEAEVQFSSNHHGVLDHLGPGHELRGVVRSIRVMTCAREPQPHPNPSGIAWVVVPGSAQLREVQVADAWEPEPPADEPQRSFEGWIVEVDVEQLR
jgi:hypothetical protein